jgi:hypothetical protein
MAPFWALLGTDEHEALKIIAGPAQSAVIAQLWRRDGTMMDTVRLAQFRHARVGPNT